MFNRNGLADTFDPMMINHQLEALEPRVLLTTLVGGDIFEYIDSQGQTVRVVLEGDAIIELIGGDINNSIVPSADDPSSALILGDLPGYIYQSDLGRVGDIAGGLGGADGVELRATINITDNVNAGGGGTVSSPSDRISISALATHPDTGNTWGVNLITLTLQGSETAITVAQVIEFNAESGNGIVRYSYQLAGNIVNGNDEAPIVGVVAAAFDIRAGEEDVLYFVTQHGGTVGYEILSVDTSDGTLSDPPTGILGSVAAADGQNINGISFDRTGPGANDVQLVVSVLGKATPPEGGDPVAAGRIFRYTSAGDFFNLTSAGTPVTVRLAGEFVDDITGIAFKGDNAAAADRYLYATTPGGLLLIDLNTGFAQFMGQLLDPDDLRDTPRGTNIADLTWDADSVNPFTGAVGVLVGSDIETDELVYIDDRPRFATADIYAIYVSQSSENAKISIAVVPPVDPDNFDPSDPFKGRGMLPFEGNIGSLRVLDISNEDPLAGTILVSAPDGTGGVIIGARTEEVDPLALEEDLLPIVAATLTQSIGVRPAGLDTEPNSDHNLAAGIYVAPSVVEYISDAGTWTSRLLGSNLDSVTSLAVNRFGTVVAVDTDLSNSAGVLTGDQLFTVNTTTGKGGSIVNIADGGGSLTGTAAIAYGFADLSSITGAVDEELYAIVENRFGVLNTTTGFFTQITANLTALAGNDLPVNATVRSMAFAPGGAGGKQTLYLIVDDNGSDASNQSSLYTLEYNIAGGAISSITGATLKGAIQDDNNDDVYINAITFDASGRLLAQDRDNGRYVLLDPATAAITVLDESPTGSLRATVGGFAYDLDGDRILVTDNAVSQSVIADEAGSAESAALMQIKTGAAGQQFGTILIGGTITGQVYFSGSIDTFYAGWIVTGQTGGQTVGEIEIPENFYVEGDIRNLVTTATIGTDNLIIGSSEGEAIRYNSGVEFFVQGRIGQIFGGDSGIFRTTVQNFDVGVSLSAADLAQTEIEFRAGNSDFDQVDSPGVAFQEFHLFNGTLFNNDTYDTAQIVGTLTTGTPGEDDIIRISGALVSGTDNEGGEEEADNSDPVDFYAIALLAGQTISIRLENIGAKLLPVGVYDPDGRLIGSESDPFTDALIITAERPGLYAIGVGVFHELATIVASQLPPDYILVVEGAGTVSLGGINMTNSLHYNFTDGAINIENGDLGAIKAGGTVFFDAAAAPTYPQFTDIAVSSGNLRVVSAGAIGNGGLLKSAGLNANVSGDIGLLRSTTGGISLPATFVGGDIQAIEAAEELMLNVFVNGGIGTIYAGSMPGGDEEAEVFDKSFIRVNDDNLGQDGIIDLIDVRDNFEDVAIITNSGGNVRYIRVGGEVSQDTFFTEGSFGTISGAEISAIDDSGARVNLAAAAGGNLEVTTYGIRGSGGSVIIKVESTSGLAITSITGQNLQPAEVSEIIVSGVGHGVIFNENNGTISLDRDTSIDPVNLAIGGSSPLDIFSIVGIGFDAISNTSGGELVNITAKSIGALYAAGSIGIAKRNSNAAVLAREVIFDGFPFTLQRNAIIAGDIVSVRSDQAVGNIIAGTAQGEVDTGGSGTIGSIYANGDNRNVADVFEGIAGPIYAAGAIQYVNIGEGLASEGSGEMAASGIYALGEIGTVVNQGAGSDIRGAIVSTTGFNQIILTGGGSIIDGSILTLSDLAQASPVADDADYLTFDGAYLNKLSIQGNGGIIGSQIISNDIRDISVNGGFGIINTTIGNTAGGTIGKVYADGFGLRTVYVGFGATIGSITAGERSDDDLSISNYTASVRASEFDPDNATTQNDLFSALNGDLFSSGRNATNGNRDIVLGALDPSPTLNADYLYTAGVIFDMFAQGSLNLGTVNAFHIEDSTFNFANSIGTISTDENQVNINLTTGTINTITTGSSRMRGDIIDGFYTIAGNINTITAYGDINNTLIVANNNGLLNRLMVNEVRDPDTGIFSGGNFTNDSLLDISGRVNTISIDGDIDNSSIIVRSGSAGRYAVNRFTLGGDLNGTLELFDDVSTLSIAGSLTGDRLVVGGDLRSLIVGSDRSIMGVEMSIDLVVLGDLGSLTVNGILSGNVTVTGDLQRLTVTADSTQTGMDILTGDINVTEGIRSISIRDGNVSGDVFAGRDLSTFTITNGDFNSTASATSLYGGIRSFSVSGDMDGLIEVDNGDLSTLRVGGNMGATANIMAMSARSVTVTGQIVGGATIEIDRVISSITAGYIGDGVTAANITAGGIQSLTTRGVRGINDGDLYANLVLGDSGRAARITTFGNFGGTAVVDGDLSLSVRGNVDMDVTAGEYLMVNGNVSSLRVTGDLSGGIFVQGEGGNWTANSITNAIITTGFDLRGLTVREGVTDSLIQVGLWAGDDMTFASIDGQQDLGEQSRQATLGRFMANSVDNSIISAGGDLTTVTVREDVTDSSFSAGWSVGSLAINERMGGELDGDVLREQDGRALFSGSMRTFTAGDITDSYITAGVDAGVGGDFSAPTVILDNAIRAMIDGGGMSELGSIRGATNAGTRIVADTGITRDSTTGTAAINGNVTYAIADLEQGNAMPASVGIATQANPLVYTDSGLTVTITVRGDGSVDARDLSLADGILDGLVITGTTSRTTITIETSVAGAVDIGRIFTSDDSELSSFSFDGGIVGDDTAGLDVWFDGGMRTLDLAGFGSETSPERVTGAIGGDVSTFNLGFQESGTLRISGSVRTMTVDAGTGDPLQINLQTYAGRNFGSMAFDGANVYGVDGGTIYTIDPLNNALITGQAVTDVTLGTGLNIVGLDIDNTSGDVFAVAEIFNPTPTVKISGVNSNFEGLAVRGDGAVFAIDHSANTDRLVQIDTTTGAPTIIGTLQDIFGNSYGSNAGSQVMTLAFRGNILTAILTDRDAAAGGAYPVGNDITIAAISTTANVQGFVRVTSPTGNQALPPVTLAVNGGEDYTGMTTNAAGDVFVVRNDNQVVQINITTGADVGAASTFAGLTFTGIGYDSNDNLIGLDVTSNQLYVLDLGTNTATALSNTTVAPGLTAFAIGKSFVNGGYVTYAYDDLAGGGGGLDERAFYTNPGRVSTIGIVDPTNGEFTQLAPLAQDEDGNSLDGNVISISVDSTNNQVKVLTDLGQLVTYNIDGSLDTGTDIIDLLDSDDALMTTITKIDFAADGRLLGIDSLGKQLVSINTTTGVVSALTEPGSVQGDISGFTIDEVAGQGLIFNNDNDQVAALAGFTQDALGGINASEISRLTLGDDYAGRISALGDLDLATINGDFAGALSTGGDMRSLTVNGGEFNGTVYAAGDISRATFRDADFDNEGLLWTNKDLSMTVTGGRDFDGLINGKIVAGNLTSLTSRSDFNSNATIIAKNDAGTISLGGTFDGMMDLAQVSRSITLTGMLLSGASVVVHGDATTLTLRDGAQANTLIAVEGAVRSLTVSETFSGVVGVMNGLQRASFDTLTNALISAGLDTQSVTVRGHATSSLISLGTWFGEDHTYNTLDDVITGGEVRTVSISGNYTDSMTAVGVLPSFELGGFIPGTTDTAAFLGSAAEAGGVVPSVLGSFSVRGEIARVTFSPGVVSADEITRVSTGQTGNILQQSTYSDPYGPIQIISDAQLTNSRFEIILSEPVLSSSVRISVDRNGDNAITVNSGDQQGSIYVTDVNGDVVNNITLTTSTRVVDGQLRGIITGVSATPMAGNIGDITIFYRSDLPTQETFEENPVLMDRSGLRSALRNFNGDPLGTLLDTDDDGFEG